MQRKLRCGYVDETGLFDFIVKERLARAYEGMVLNKKVSFHRPFNASDVPLFDIPFYTLSKELKDFKAEVRDFGMDDVYDYEIEFSDLPLSFFAVVGVFMTGEFTYKGLKPVSRGMDDCQIIGHIQRGCYDEMDDKQEGLLLEFVRATRLYISGEKELALSCDIFRKYCETLAYLFAPYGVDLPPEYAADNILDMMSGFVDVSDDMPARYIMYCSREVVLFDKYKHLLPSDIKERAEAYIRIFKEPTVNGDAVATYRQYGEYGVVVLTEYLSSLEHDFSQFDEDMVFDAEACTRYFNVFFETAVKWLDENLPILRKEYLDEVSIEKEARAS